MTRAVVLVADDRSVTVDDVHALDPGARDVVVRVTASGVCHTDVNVVEGRSPSRPPLVLGHEGTGIVEEAGADVTRVRVGDRVVGSFVPTCGDCAACRDGRSVMCRSYRHIVGVDRYIHPSGTRLRAMAGLGAFAESMVCHETSLVPVRTDLADTELAVLGCAVITGVGAVLNAARVTPGSSVVVFGCGGVGQNVVQGARIAGATSVIAVEPSGAKRDLALRLGADRGLDPGAAGAHGVQGIVDEVREATNGLGADYAFEVTGRPELLVDALHAVRPGGTVVAVGFGGPDAMAAIPVHELVAQQKRLVGSLYGSGNPARDIPRLAAWVESGDLDVGSLVSRTVSLEALAGGLDALSGPDVVRCIVVP